MSAVQYVTNPQKVLPSAADSASCTASGTAWTNGNWAVISSSAPTAGVLTGIAISTNADTQKIQFEIDIGVGSAGNEVVIATFKGSNMDVIGTSENLTYTLPIGIDGWSAFDRIVARVRVGNTTASVWTVAITYYTPPINGRFQTTVNPLQCLPSNSTGLILGTGGSAWVNGSYQALSSALPTKIAIVGLAVRCWAQNGDYQSEFDLATGSAGNEVVFCTFKFEEGDFFSTPGFAQLMVPIEVASGARLTARARDSADFPYNNQTYSFSIMYIAMPF